jgi:hypothetical protein
MFCRSSCSATRAQQGEPGIQRFMCGRVARRKRAAMAWGVTAHELDWTEPPAGSGPLWGWGGSARFGVADEVCCFSGQSYRTGVGSAEPVSKRRRVIERAEA